MFKYYSNIITQILNVDTQCTLMFACAHSVLAKSIIGNIHRKRNHIYTQLRHMEVEIVVTFIIFRMSREFIQSVGQKMVGRVTDVLFVKKCLVSLLALIDIWLRNIIESKSTDVIYVITYTLVNLICYHIRDLYTVSSGHQNLQLNQMRHY